MKTNQIYRLQELLWSYYSDIPHTAKQLNAIKEVYRDVSELVRLDEDELDFIHIDSGVRKYMANPPRSRNNERV